MKRSLLMTGIIVGALLMVSPVVGLLGTVFGINQAFSVLARSGVKEPQALSARIGTTLVWTAAGVVSLSGGRCAVHALVNLLPSTSVVESATAAPVTAAIELPIHGHQSCCHLRADVCHPPHWDARVRCQNCGDQNGACGDSADAVQFADSRFPHVEFVPGTVPRQTD